MPVYEYECEKCGHDFEREQRISDPPVKTCPACRSRRVRKLISRSSFVLKGGGWYADGYSDTRKSTATNSDTGSSGTESSAPAAAGSETKVDSSAASKTGGDSKPKSTPKTPSKTSSGDSKSGKKQSAA